MLFRSTVPDPTRLMLSPDASQGGSGAVASVGGGTMYLQENRTYNFIVQNPYVVGSALDKNFYRLNDGKSPITISGNISGQWLKFNPTLVRLGYSPTNQSGVVVISSPSNLTGYQIPLKLLNLI